LLLSDAPLVGIRVGAHAQVPGAWQLAPRWPNVDYKKLAPGLLALNPKVLMPSVLKSPIKPSVLRALQAAASSEADRWLIEAAALEGLSKAEVSRLKCGNSTRARRRKSETLEKAEHVVGIHEAYRRLAEKDALEEASIFLGGDPLSQAEVLTELEVMNQEDAEEDAAFLAHEKKESKIVSIDELEGNLLAAVDLMTADGEDEAAEALELTKSLETAAGGPLSESSAGAKQALGLTWFHEVTRIFEDDDHSEDIVDPYSSDEMSGDEKSVSSSSNDEEDAQTTLDAIKRGKGNARKIVLQCFARTHRRRRREAGDFVRKTINFGRKKGYVRESNILNKYPDVANALEEILQNRRVGADAWRRDSAFIMNTAQKKKAGSGVGGLRKELAERGYIMSRHTVRRLGVAARERVNASSRYKGAVKFRLKRNVKRLAAENVDSHFQLATKRSDAAILAMADPEKVAYVQRDDMAALALNAAPKNCQPLPTVVGQEHRVNKHEFVSSDMGTSIQATTYYGRAVGRSGEAPEVNLMLVKANSKSPSTPHQHAADDAMLRRRLGESHGHGDPSEVASSMLYSTQGKLKSVKIFDVDNGPDECVRRPVRRWLAAEEMCGGPYRHPDLYLSHVQLTSLASGDTDQKGVERLNACGRQAIGSLCLDVDVYQEQFGNCYDVDTGTVDDEKVSHMHAVMAEEYRSLLNGAPGLNGATIIAMPAATVDDGPEEREILTRAAALEKLCDPHLSKIGREKMKVEHPALFEHWSFVEKRRKHWESSSKYKVSYDLCGKADCDLCEGHAPAGTWGAPGTPAVGILPYPYPDPARPGHYLDAEAAIAEHTLALTQHRKPPKPPSEVAIELFRRLRQGSAITAPINMRHVEMAVAEIKDSACTSAVMLRLFEKMRLIQLRRAAGAKKAQETKRKQTAAQHTTEPSGDKDEGAPEAPTRRRKRNQKEESAKSDSDSAGDAESEEDESDVDESDESDSKSEESDSDDSTTSPRAATKTFTDSDLAVGDRVTVAWPDDSLFHGIVRGRPSKKDSLHVLESDYQTEVDRNTEQRGEPTGLPPEHSCARIILFDDGDTLRLGLPKERQIRASREKPRFGFWRREEDNPNEARSGKKRAQSGIAQFFGTKKQRNSTGVDDC
jgi:hypothetical protein